MFLQWYKVVILLFMIHLTKMAMTNAFIFHKHQGFADYFAMSYSRPLSNWNPSDPEYNWRE